MRSRNESALAVWLSCIGIGLLFMARGAFQPYIFPLFENLAGLSYAEIAVLANCYLLAQSLFAPIAGWFIDRTSINIGLSTGIACGLGSFLAISTDPGYAGCVVAVLAAGSALVLGKIALNTILVLHSSAETLRRSVAKRATLLNLGSFLGNTASQVLMTRIGYAAHAVFLGLLHLPIAVCLLAPAAHHTAQRKREKGTGLKTLLRSRPFLADAISRFAIVLPYGCWGTVIPKYVIDQYGSTAPVWTVYLTSLLTTVFGAHFLAVYVSPRFVRRGFRWESWSAVSLALYCTGLMLLMFARNPFLLPVAVVVFICGEVAMTPCFDETAKKHGHLAGMGTCLGALHLVDGMGRLLGAAFALAVYGYMRSETSRDYYWPVVVVSFLLVSTALLAFAGRLGRGHPGASAPAPDGENTTFLEEAAE